MSQSLNYEPYTNLSPIIKSAKYALIPVGKTKSNFERANVMEKDEQDRDIKEKCAEIGKQYILNIILDKLVDGVNAGLNKVIEDYAAEYNRRQEDLGHFKDIRAEFLEKINAEIIGAAKSDKLFDFSASNVIEKFTEYVSLSWNEDMPFTAEEATDVLTNKLKGKTAYLLGDVITKWMNVCTGTKGNSFSYRLLENIEIYLSNAQAYKSIVEQKFDEVSFPEVPTSLENMGRFLLQKEIDAYNERISEIYDDDGKKIAIGFNEQLNIVKKRFKNAKGTMLSKLKKQIYTYSEPLFTVETAKSIEDVVGLANESIKAMDGLAASAEAFCRLLDTKEQDIYFRSSSIGELSFIIYKDARTLRAALGETIRKNLLSDQKLRESAISDEVKKVIAQNDYSLEEMQQLMDTIVDRENADIYDTLSKNIREAISECQIRKRVAEKAIKSLTNRGDDFFDALRVFYEACTNLRRKLIIFVPGKESTLNSLDASEAISKGLADADIINKAHNMTRSFATRSVKVIEPELQTGLGSTAMLSHNWETKNDMIQNQTHALLEKDGKYYYFAVTSGKKEHYIPLMPDPKGSCYKIVYMRKANSLYKSLKRYIVPLKVQEELADEDKNYFVISKDKGDIAVDRAFLSEVNENKLKDRTGDSLTEAIGKIMEICDKSSSFDKFDLSGIKPPQEYKTFKQFAEDFDNACVTMTVKYIDSEMVHNAVDAGVAFLFEIFSRDLYKDKCTDSNAIYLRNFMENCLSGERKFDMILNSSPQVRYRKVAIKEAGVTHKKGSLLVRKTITEANGTITKIPEDIYKNIYLYVNNRITELSAEEEAWLKRLKKNNGFNPSIRPANSDIIKDKRYTEDRFTLTLSFTIYPHGKHTNDVGAYLNNMVRERIKNEKVKILSICRGHYSLLGYCFMEEDGTVLEQGDLSVINGIDYYKRLTDLSNLRNEEKKRWKNDRVVKNIRENYACDVSAVIARMAIENDALIAIENIPQRVKDKKACVDNQMFKLFETKLINKLSSYGCKNIPEGKIGSFTHPIQLAVPASKQMSPIQNGIIFYTSMALTRNVDAETGFINLLDTTDLTTVGSKRELLNEVDVCYEKARDIYTVSFTYDNVGNILSEKQGETENKKRKKADSQDTFNAGSHVWTVAMVGSRNLLDRVHDRYIRYHATERIRRAFEDADLEVPQIDGRVDTNSLPTNVVEEFVKAFLLYCRGTVVDSNTVYYQSPITGKISDISPDVMAAKQLGLKTVFTLDGLREGKKQNIVISKCEWANKVMQKE